MHVSILRVLIAIFIWVFHTLEADQITCSEKKILICGVCKNVGHVVPNTIRNIETLGKKFKDYTGIIYENNSQDETDILFKRWASVNNKVIFMSEFLTERQLLEGIRCYRNSGEPSRMERIAIARNKVLAVARESRFDDFDYLIMADLDFKKPWPIPPVVNM